MTPLHQVCLKFGAMRANRTWAHRDIYCKHTFWNSTNTFGCSTENKNKKTAFSWHSECAYSDYKLFIQQCSCELCIIMLSTAKGGHGGLKASDASYLLGLAQGYGWIASSLKKQGPELQDFTQPLVFNWHRSNQHKNKVQPKNPWSRLHTVCGLIWGKCTDDSNCSIRFCTVVAKPHVLLKV